MEFSKILTEIILDLQVTQTEFATKIGVKQSQVSEWLKGKSYPGYTNLKNICIAYGISADALLGLEQFDFKLNKSKIKSTDEIEIKRRCN